MLSFRLSPIFALLLFVAHMNCVFEHQIGEAELIGEFDSGSRAPTPVPSDEHELIGCICKGAIVADSTTVEFNDTAVERFNFVSIALTDSTPGQVFAFRDPLGGKTSQLPPLLGSERHSYLQVFLI